MGTLISVQLGTASPKNIWEEYIKPSAAAAGAILAAVIAGVFGYLNIMKQLKTTTRNAFLDMLVSNSTYRNHIDSFLTVLYEEKFDALKEKINSEAFFYLFLLKPNI
jgi:hypothetical protein